MFVLVHVSSSVPDLDQASPFYDAVMAALGVAQFYDRPDAIGYGVRYDSIEDFHSCLAIHASANANVDDKRHWCFKATTRQQLIEFHRAGLADCGRDNGAPALRHYHPTYFGAFLHDPFGNRIEAVGYRAELNLPQPSKGKEACDTTCSPFAPPRC
ncbi:MAG: VOC family protein [Candidatus Accumulibacter sp.]|uniref:Lactoylglutathione lyase n=1 Tax=Candidatus Accumulibacter phosphatis TaxID=327160 RepID=A0A5S4EL38_9PROT|nr:MULTISPECIES: VOC family protein [Candidatus Accumulibacter]MBN8519673.1 VOC family protein [Accumulibacter sp.]MBO3713353.1 VOC family protein [Accumulibacter sp.]TMQ76072.1 Lactoylglutathione lyase [Candidatus Accumulibacter phosphatis]HRD28887.1 hypothetical protein [Caulobacter sp.]